ncbi:hypothetical protein [Streptomyces sp. NPDC048496]
MTVPASQPLWLFWENEWGRAVSHAPDCFVRRAGEAQAPTSE